MRRAEEIGTTAAPIRQQQAGNPPSGSSERRPRPAADRLFDLWRYVVTLAALAACLSGSPIARAASPPADVPAATGQAAPAKIQQFIDLLADPEVRDWIVQHAATAPGVAAAPPGTPATSPAATPESPPSDEVGTMPGAMSERVGSLRERLVEFVDALRALPADLDATWASFVHKMHRGHGVVRLAALVAAFLALGYGTQKLYFLAVRPVRQWLVGGATQVTVNERVRVVLLRFALGIGIIGSFALGSIGAFLLVDWPTAPRRVVLGYLFAFLCVQFAKTIRLFLLSPPHPKRPRAEDYRIVPINGVSAQFWSNRLIFATAWLAFGSVTIDLLGTFDLTLASRIVLYHALDLGLLAIGLESAWRSPKSFLDHQQLPRWHHMGHPVLASLMSAYLIVLWLLWTAGLKVAFALVLLLVGLPALIDLAQRSIGHILRPPGAQQDDAELQSVLSVILERAVRAILIAGAAIFLSQISGIGLAALATQDTLLTRLARDLLNVIVIVLVADLIWQVARVLIDVKLRGTPASGLSSSPETSRQARLLTLLPILRNVLFMVIGIIALMMALSSWGVQIGPLIASAGVVGVAVGFGAQTLVRDVLSGVFYLLDDAFRVGEYIQSGNYKGVVESFSLRSIKLRHQRGPIYTVPFGALGAVQNMSRDWTIEKMSVTVAYSTDLSKVKPLIKQIGKELLADPELAPHIIETLKLQGVENFTDYGILMRMKMTTKPGEQFIVRRRAFALIKQAFDANGIEFATPVVQVGSVPDAAGAAAASRSLELAQAARAASSSAA